MMIMMMMIGRDKKVNAESSDGNSFDVFFVP